MYDIEELDSEIKHIKAALYDIDEQRSKLQGILEARKNDKQIALQRARQADADAAAAKRAAEQQAAAEKATHTAKPKGPAPVNNEGDTAQPKA